MPAVRCDNCGGLTNSTLSEYWDQAHTQDGKALKCYAKLVNGKWVRGCAYYECDGFQKKFADNVINSSLRKRKK